MHPTGDTNWWHIMRDAFPPTPPTTLPEILIAMTIPAAATLAVAGLTNEQSDAVIRNADILILVGLGVVLAIGVYMVVERMINSRVKALEETQEQLKRSLEALARKLDNVTELLTQMQISQQKMAASLFTRADIEEKMNGVIACHERDCPARRAAHKG